MTASILNVVTLNKIGKNGNLRALTGDLQKIGRKVGISLKKRLTSRLVIGIITLALKEQCAAMAQVVEHVLGKDEVTSSNLVSSSTKNPQKAL